MCFAVEIIASGFYCFTNTGRQLTPPALTMDIDAVSLLGLEDKTGFRLNFLILNLEKYQLLNWY
ncbi:hypothetical protein ABN584_16700 [Gloeocapsa sp. BRSZ]